MQIQSLDSLRTLYAQPQERAVKKQIAALDQHCESFIALSPFLILSTCDEDFNLDASPRGGDPGFVKVDAVAGSWEVPSYSLRRSANGRPPGPRQR